MDVLLRAGDPIRPRRGARLYTLNLTGEMVGYFWSINNTVWNEEVPPLPLAKGERVEVIMNNRTGMSHPMHLHAQRSQLVEIAGSGIPGAASSTIRRCSGKPVRLAVDS